MADERRSQPLWFDDKPTVMGVAPGMGKTADRHPKEAVTESPAGVKVIPSIVWVTLLTIFASCSGGGSRSSIVFLSSLLAEFRIAV